jgi:hypothetical protein
MTKREKRDWTAKPKVLTLENNNLIKIRVNQDIVYKDGWEKKNWLGINLLELKPITLPSGQAYIELFRDNVFLGKWRLFEQYIPGLPRIKLEDGSTKPCSPPIIYYAIGSDGLKYRWLYFRSFGNGQFHIGTRKDIGARWQTTTMSKKKRQHFRECMRLGLSKHQLKKRKISAEKQIKYSMSFSQQSTRIWVRQNSIRSRWRQSSGSKMEIALAKSLGLDIKFLRNRRGLANRS